MPTVALFNVNFLPYSETFVFDEIRHHERWAVEVFAWRRLNPGLFPFEPVYTPNLFYGFSGWSPHFERIVRQRKFDLVHAHFGLAGIYGVRYAELANLPFVVTFHGNDVALLTSHRRFLRPDYWPYAAGARRMLRRMTVGLCASTELRDLLVDYGVEPSRLIVYRLGIDLTLFRPHQGTRDRLEVVMIGRFVEKKGFEYGIQGFAKAVRNGMNGQLTIIGTGEREQRLKDLVASLHADDCIRFAGVLPAKEVAATLAAADVLLAPSVTTAGGDRESGLIAAKEASASGVVPIGSRHGGIPEIIDDEVTGFLVGERDVDAIADRLTRLHRDPALRTTMGLAARAKMEREYDIRVRVQVLEQHYDQALERFRTRS